MIAPGGTCMVAWGGMCGCFRGACVIAQGACMVARGACVVARGHAWLPGGVCMVAPMGGCMVSLGGMHGCSRGEVRGCSRGLHGFSKGHAWLLLGGMHGIQRDTQIRSMSRRYASYWNAFLFLNGFTRRKHAQFPSVPVTGG